MDDSPRPHGAPLGLAPRQVRRAALLATASSFVLATVKIVTGVLGHSWALVADGIESLADMLSTLAVLVGLTYSLKPPDEKHPYGHGKVETFSVLFVALALVSAAVLIGVQSVREIRNPQQGPEWFTLPVLVVVIVVKVAISRGLRNAGRVEGSVALEADSWHHFSDALTSAAAFIGISIALLGGEAYASADDWAALAACSIILWNGVRFGAMAVQELLEAQVPTDVENQMRVVTEAVPGVMATEKLRARKSGMGCVMDIHVEVDGGLSVREGHDIARAVKHALLDSDLRITDVTVHIEPHDE